MPLDDVPSQKYDGTRMTAAAGTFRSTLKSPLEAGFHTDPGSFLVSQTDSALRASSGENLAAVGGSHSLAEAVLLGTLALLGLVSTKHMNTSLRENIIAT